MQDAVESNHRILWGGIGVKIKVAFHCADLVFYVVVFAFTDAGSSFYDGDPIL